MKIVVSACLLGENCKYNGGNNYCQKVVNLVKGREVIRVCPEVLAGMPVPRVPIEIKDGIVVDRDGNVVDAVIREAVENCTGEKPQIIDCADFACAVTAAAHAAKCGDIVLMSPASAAFDQFKNFMVRGAFFKKMIMEL